jgi:hypothetical protein
MKLTIEQKMHALSNAMYLGGVKWIPKGGDFYTTSRADLELYRVISVENGVVKTKYTEGSNEISEWPELGFLTEGFGQNRIHVPDFILKMDESTQPMSAYDGVDF